jgi:Trypsin-like peptidase domain/VHL beta domain
MDARQTRLIVSFNLFYSLLTIYPSLAQPADAPQGERYAYDFRANTVQIRTSFESGYGFVVAARGEDVTVVTADHVVRDADDTPYKQITVEFFTDPGHPVAATLNNYRIPRQYGDLAIIEVKKPGFVLQPTTFALLPLTEGTEAWRIGKHGGWTPANRAGVYTGKLETIWLGFDSLDTPRGSSGGPVLSNTGLIGMVIKDDEAGPAFVLPINTISEYFSEKHLPWNLGSQPAAPQMTLTFTNKTGQSVDFFWLDTSGKAIPYPPSIPDGGQTQFSTYKGHVWSARTTGGKELHRYVADPSTPNIIIDPANSSESDLRTSSASSQTETFSNPMYAVLRLDFCYNFAVIQSCGLEAAKHFCNSQHYRSVADNDGFDIDPGIGGTISLGDNRVGGRDGFKFIKCVDPTETMVVALPPAEGFQSLNLRLDQTILRSHQ